MGGRVQFRPKVKVRRFTESPRVLAQRRDHWRQILADAHALSKQRRLAAFAEAQATPEQQRAPPQHSNTAVPPLELSQVANLSTGLHVEGSPDLHAVDGCIPELDDSMPEVDLQAEIDALKQDSVFRAAAEKASKNSQQ